MHYRGLPEVPRPTVDYRRGRIEGVVKAAGLIAGRATSAGVVLLSRHGLQRAGQRHTRQTMSQNHIGAIAQQIRELVNEADRGYALEMAGRLLAELLDRRGLASDKFLRLRLECDAQRDDPYMLVQVAVAWLIRNRDSLHLPAAIEFWDGPASEGGGINIPYVETNLPAFADVIEWSEVNRKQQHAVEEVLDINVDTGEIQYKGETLSLGTTKKEFWVFAELADRRGKKVAVDTLIDRVWGKDWADKRTVFTTVSRLRTHLKVAPFDSLKIEGTPGFYRLEM